MSLFSRMVTAASLWVHLLAINLVSARSILRDGEDMVNRHLAIALHYICCNIEGRLYLRRHEVWCLACTHARRAMIESVKVCFVLLVASELDLRKCRAS